jgi:hypothetical protein
MCAATAALPPTCAPAARTVIGRAFGASVRERVGESGQATPECVFRVGRARVTVLVDSFSQPYQRLERVQIEDAQQLGAQRLEAVPRPLRGLGIDAYRFPTERKVMTTKGRRLITVFVVKPGLSARRQRRLSEARAGSTSGLTIRTPPTRTVPERPALLWRRRCLSPSSSAWSWRC